jgi:uncharacterized protein YbjT (DUF2867 family)
MILVTGATGQTGSAVVAQLVSRGVPVRAMVRSVQRGHGLLHLPGPHDHDHGHGGHGYGHGGHGAHNALVQLAVADFDEPDTLARALDGVTRAYLVTSSTARAQGQQLAFVAAAERAGVEHVVKLSQFGAREDSPVRFLRYHAAVEAALEASAMDVTVLRPNLFMQGVLMFADFIRAKNAFFAAAGDAPVSLVDVEDVSAAAAAALTGDGHAGRTYTLTGPAAVTHAEIAQTLSDVLGRPIEYVDVAPEHLRAAMVGMGMDPWQADGLVEDYAHYRRGEAAEVTTGVRDATGAAPTDLRSFVEAYADLLAA